METLEKRKQDPDPNFLDNLRNQKNSSGQKHRHYGLKHRFAYFLDPPLWIPMRDSAL